MYMSQVLEHSMVNALIVLRTLPTHKDHADEASWLRSFDDAYDSGFQHTFGNMVNALEKIDAFPRPIISRLRSAKTSRDELAHSFFRNHALAFHSPAGRTTMIGACEDRIELFSAVGTQIDEFLLPIIERHGISKEWIDKAYGKSLQMAELGDFDISD